ncbi:MAG TPA: MOSC domain-containing protein, partial [Phnomibacter sp.]|nr:MOSC domain-containing protein [Phnomibacter sp.]
KSLGGIEVLQSKVMPKGLEYDRRWMLIDERDHFMTQRHVPKMAMFRSQWDAVQQGFVVQHGAEKVWLREGVAGDVVRAVVWKDVVNVLEVDAALSEWFSEKLGRRCRLVFFPEDAKRDVDADFAVHPHDQTSLSDGYPVLMVGQASLDDLNSRLDEPVGIERFRPNIVFAGALPFEEDGWKKINVGPVEMAVVKPCSRCVMTTIDPATGIAGKEPLATLSRYRQVGNKVMFGQNVIPMVPGTIAVGDVIIPR